MISTNYTFSSIPYAHLESIKVTLKCDICKKQHEFELKEDIFDKIPNIEVARFVLNYYLENKVQEKIEELNWLSHELWLFCENCKDKAVEFAEKQKKRFMEVVV